MEIGHLNDSGDLNSVTKYIHVHLNVYRHRAEYLGLNISHTQCLLKGHKI